MFYKHHSSYCWVCLCIVFAICSNSLDWGIVFFNFIQQMSAIIRALQSLKVGKTCAIGPCNLSPTIFVQKAKP